MNSMNSTKKKYTQADFTYSVLVLVFLVLQFGTIIYQSYVGTLIATVITVLELMIFAIAWLWYSGLKHIIQKQILLTAPLIILMLILIIKLMMTSGYSDDYFSPVNSLYQLYSIIYSILLGYSVLYLPKQLRLKILNYFYMLMTITVIPSFFYVLNDSNAIRNGEDLFGIIDFQYIYAVLPFIAISLIALLHCRVRGKLKFWMTCAILSNSAIIILSNYATALILLFIALALGVVVGKRFKIKYFLIIIFFIIGIVILFRGQIAQLCLTLAEGKIFGTVMKHRLQDIAKIMNGNGVGWSFLARINLMSYSWQSFVKSPILGISFNNAGYGDLGFHETWITLLAYSGAIGLICVLLSIGIYLKSVIRKKNNRFFFNAYFSSLILIVILSLLNPIFSKSIMMIPCVVMPLTFDIFTKKMSYHKRVLNLTQKKANALLNIHKGYSKCCL